MAAPTRSSKTKDCNTNRKPIDSRINSYDITRVIKLSSLNRNPHRPTTNIVRAKDRLKINMSRSSFSVRAFCHFR
jgi:hypothetical protein